MPGLSKGSEFYEINNIINKLNNQIIFQWSPGLLLYIMRLPFFLCNKRSRSHQSLGLSFADHIPVHTWHYYPNLTRTSARPQTRLTSSISISSGWFVFQQPVSVRRPFKKKPPKKKRLLRKDASTSCTPIANGYESSCVWNRKSSVHIALSLCNSIG